jgi:hypothetical protein
VSKGASASARGQSGARSTARRFGRGSNGRVAVIEGLLGDKLYLQFIVASSRVTDTQALAGPACVDLDINVDEGVLENL